MRKQKEKIYKNLFSSDEQNVTGKIFDIIIIALIFLNVFLVIANTFENVPSVARLFFRQVEIFSVIVFSIEYILRLWTSDLIYPRLSPWRARVKYFFSFMALVDLLSILPFYLPFLITIDLRVLRMLRMLRLLRILKINRYTKALSTVSNVIKNKTTELISSTFVVLILMVMTSVLMYSIEHKAQPDVFENAFSGLWWAACTFTTVGYGDIVPITWWGRLLGGIIALMGIGLVAVPTGIISAGFVEEIEKEKNSHYYFDSEDEILERLSKINNLGKQKIIDYIDDIVTTGKYDND